MKFSKFAIVAAALVFAGEAQANEYEHYTVRCDVYGTQQTLSQTALHEGTTTESYPSMLMQTHFKPEELDGLAYHLYADDCVAHYVDPRNKDRRVGH